MCDFYSAVANRTRIYHDSSNSHSQMIEELGWKENTRDRTYFWEFELDISEKEPTVDNIVRGSTDPDTIPEKVMRNALSHYQTIYNVLHGIGGIPEFVWKDEYFDVRCSLARNPSITSETQKILSKDEDANVKYSLAENSSITPEIQKILSKDKDFYIRCSLAENLSITPEIQKILSKDEYSWVRQNLAYNPLITPETQKILSKDEYSWVRYNLAYNPSITPEIKKALDNS